MRHIRTILLALGVAAIAAACSKDEGPFVAPKQSIAYVRYLHAVPDTGQTDWRPIDALENSPPVFGLNYRGFTPYQAMGSGARKIRVFPTSTNINITSVPLVDTTITFTENTYYTLVYTGLARAGGSPKARLVLIQDQIPDVASSAVSVRVVNLSVGLGSVDVFASAAGGTSPLPAAPLLNAVVEGAVSAYTSQSPGPLALRLTAAGTRSPVLADVLAPPGQAGNATQNLTPVGGSTMGGSAFTAFIFSRSVAGSTAASFTTPGIVYVIDKHPPR